jgi:hypothetical protein
MGSLYESSYYVPGEGYFDCRTGDQIDLTENKIVIIPTITIKKLYLPKDLVATEGMAVNIPEDICLSTFTEIRREFIKYFAR